LTQQLTTSESPQLASNKALTRKLNEAINTGSLEIIATVIDEIVAPDAIVRTPLPIAATGAQLLNEIFARLLRAFPDIRITASNVIAQADQVVSENVVTGTNLGEFMGRPPTGTFVTYREIFVVRFAGGRIVETSGIVDSLALLKQLGAIPE
jgi:predicted ester cyclase